MLKTKYSSKNCSIVRDVRWMCGRIRKLARGPLTTTLNKWCLINIFIYVITWDMCIWFAPHIQRTSLTIEQFLDEYLVFNILTTIVLQTGQTAPNKQTFVRNFRWWHVSIQHALTRYNLFLVKYTEEALISHGFIITWRGWPWPGHKP
jgi:hypothetical protein